MNIKNYSILALCLAVMQVYGQKSDIAIKTKILQKQYAAYDKNIKKSHRQLKKYGIPPNEYIEQDIKNTMDPKTGETLFQKVVALKKDIDAGKYKPQQQLSLLSGSKSGKFDQQWFEKGPYNTGGRTRAIMYDPNDPSGKRVFAGGISGGLWVNQDPSNNSNQWTPINDFWANISISCITYDPNNPQILYVGTGECETGDAAGSGIFKSTDGGATWTQIFTMAPSYSGNIKNGYYYINDIKVRNNAGVSEVYAGVSGGVISGNFLDGFLGLDQAGLYKSIDGGATFTKNTTFVANTTGGQQSSTGYSVQQIEIAADNSVWVSTRTSRYSNIDSGGRIFKSANGKVFTQIYNIGVPSSRTNFGLSKTNANKAYVLMQGPNTAEPIRILKTLDGGNTWSATNDTTPLITLPKDTDTGIPTNDFTRGQSFYDLVITPDPLNDDIVYTGGIDLFKSTDGAATWTQISKWSNNNNLASLPVSLVHADQHAIVFNPANKKQILFGNDGGIFFVNDDASFADVSPYQNTVTARNTRYNVTQFYNATLNPTKTPSDEELLAGAQDNGTQWLAAPILTGSFLTSYPAIGGDGAYTEYDDQDNYEIASYVYNTHYLIRNAYYKLIEDQNSGHFINELALDRVNDIVYTYRSGLSIFRIPNLLTATTFTPTALTLGTAQSGEQISHLKVSPYATTSGTTLFAGTNQGRILKVVNADKTTFATAFLTTPAVGTVSDIEIGATENNIVVTLSNYNVTSIFYTTDGGTTWMNKEGNLPDMPVRTALMNPDENNEVIVGTEAGIWGTTNFLDVTPVWSQYSNGVGNVRVTWLDYRPSTKTVSAATYGRGAWTSQNSPVVLSTADPKGKNMAMLYPNPSNGNGHLKFDTAKYKSVNISVYDASGRLVYTKKDVKSDDEFVTGLRAGNYVLKAENNGTTVFTSFLLITKQGERD